MDITIDTRGLTAYLDDFDRRQVPFALANTLNDTAKLFQYRQRAHQRSIFKVRRPQFVDNSVKITKFAKKTDLVATVEIESPGGRSDILGKFESQTQKTPTSGRSIAVPGEVKRNKADIIPQSQRPRSFNFRQVGGSRMAGHASHLKPRVRSGVLRGALQVFEGEKRTVMIKNAQGKGVILQRVGRGKRADMRVLYFLTPRVKLKPNLEFIDHAKEAATHVAEFFKARFAEARATAR